MAFLGATAYSQTVTQNLRKEYKDKFKVKEKLDFF
jgi:hypothetical protein